MRTWVGGALAVAAGWALLVGCNSNPFAPAGQTSAWQQAGQQQPYEAQLAELNRRSGQLDANNRDLHAQLAQTTQQVQVMREQVSLLQRQLQDSAQQLRDSQVARQDAEQKLETLMASYQRRGGAVITANSSIRQTLLPVEIPGISVRQDGDVIRIELPTDQLFVGGGTQLQPTAYLALDQVATAILRTYPRQRVGIEAHADGGANPALASSSHQLTTAQATAVLDQLVQRNRLPPQQLFVVGHGANHPRAANSTADGRTKNRRVEIVIYPETIDGR
ncbi:MAG: OmpA family protein [Pirellulales bacterium]